MTKHLAKDAFSKLLGNTPDAATVVATMIASLQKFHDAIVIVDAKWNFLYLNAAATHYLRREADQLIGRNLWRMFPRLADTASEQTYREAMTDKKPRTIIEHHAARDLWYWVGVYPMPDALLLHVRDITDQRRAESLNDRLLQSLETRLDVPTRRKAL
ncbi:MAG: domain S-box [Candidatus Saccharibacteria bacterium]|jgi:PAS domain S-box-containing protein|nr:domain S-box [Candidatus Saccharibacteria bacterium]